MATVGEVVAFTGVAGPAGLEPGQLRLRGLRSCGEMVAGAVAPDRRRSLRGLVAALPTLPPITLEARIADHVDEVAPSRPIIEVDVSPGAVVETVVTFFSGGAPARPVTSSIALVDGQRVDGAMYAQALFPDPGTYEAVVRRVGVTSSGVVTLERRLSFRVRSAQPSPPPTPPAPGPGPARGPVCQVELAGQQPFGGTTSVRVFGGGFPPGDTLTVLQDGGFATTTVADGLGGYSVVIGVVSTAPPVDHEFQVVGSTGAATPVVGLAV